jgi:hypothetical protein
LYVYNSTQLCARHGMEFWLIFVKQATQETINAK